MPSSRTSYARRAHTTVKKPMTDKDFAKSEAEVDPKAMKDYELLVGNRTSPRPRSRMPRGGISAGRGGHGGRGRGGRGRGGRGELLAATGDTKLQAELDERKRKAKGVESEDKESSESEDEESSESESESEDEEEDHNTNTTKKFVIPAKKSSVSAKKPDVSANKSRRTIEKSSPRGRGAGRGIVAGRGGGGGRGRGGRRPSTSARGRVGCGPSSSARGRGGRGPSTSARGGGGTGGVVAKKVSPKLVEFVKKVKAYTFYALTNVQGVLLDMAYDDELLRDEALYALSQVGLGRNGALGPTIAGKNADLLADLA